MNGHPGDLLLMTKPLIKTLAFIEERVQKRGEVVIVLGGQDHDGTEDSMEEVVHGTCLWCAPVVI